MTLPSRSQRGFTLVELIVTIVILGILAGLAVPALTAVTRRSQCGASAATLEGLYREAAALAGFDDANTAGYLDEAAADMPPVSPALAIDEQAGTALIDNGDRSAVLTVSASDHQVATCIDTTPAATYAVAGEPRTEPTTGGAGTGYWSGTQYPVRAGLNVSSASLWLHADSISATTTFRVRVYDGTPTTGVLIAGGSATVDAEPSSWVTVAVPAFTTDGGEYTVVWDDDTDVSWELILPEEGSGTTRWVYNAAFAQWNTSVDAWVARARLNGYSE